MDSNEAIIEEFTPKERRKMVCQMYLQGFTYNQIMKATGYKTTSAIAKIIASKGLADRLPNFSQNQIDRMIDLWRDRLSCESIGIKMGLSKDQVRHQLKKLCLVD